MRFHMNTCCLSEDWHGSYFCHFSLAWLWFRILQITRIFAHIQTCCFNEHSNRTLLSFLSSKNQTQSALLSTEHNDCTIYSWLALSDLSLVFNTAMTVAFLINKWTWIWTWTKLLSDFTTACDSRRWSRSFPAAGASPQASTCFRPERIVRAPARFPGSSTPGGRSLTGPSDAASSSRARLTRSRGWTSRWPMSTTDLGRSCFI